jgi:H+/gluconate symporter-like permease
MASATSNLSSATAMFASVTGVSIAVLAVVTSSTIANVAPPPPPLLAGAVAVETSGSFGIIIGVLVGVIIALVLALVVMHRRRHHLNVGLHVPNGHEDEKVALARHKAERADEMVAPDEMAAPEPKPTTATKAPEAPKLLLAFEEGFELQNKPLVSSILNMFSPKQEGVQHV